MIFEKCQNGFLQETPNIRTLYFKLQRVVKIGRRELIQENGKEFKKNKKVKYCTSKLLVSNGKDEKKNKNIQKYFT